jgi:serine phosphatase RsbU (regulator of sigma subunit)
MALAAEMQWGLLPPVSFATTKVSVAGMVEPAYDVGGDAYDYAFQHEVLDVGVFDAVGHGLGSSLLAALAVGAYRNARRSGDDLEEMVGRIDAAVGSQYQDASFATALLARLDVRSGHLRIVNAGHPPPLLIRQNRVVRTIEVPPGLPLGLASRFKTAQPAVIHEEALEPGDAVFFYTDGAVEARTSAGVDFGLGRLSDFLERAMGSGLAPAEIMRRLLHAVLDHHGGTLRDDATTLLCHWHPQGREQALRGTPFGGADSESGTAGTAGTTDLGGSAG